MGPDRTPRRSPRTLTRARGPSYHSEAASSLVRLVAPATLRPGAASRSARSYSGLAAAWLFSLPLAAVPAIASQSADGGSFLEPEAVVVNVTESDLNTILKGSVRSLGGPLFEGTSQDPSKGIFDLRYRADISEPVLSLGADGKASVAFSIREARFQIGRYERRIGRRIASCENLGVSVDRRQPVDVTLGLHFAIEGRDLKVIPDSVSIPDAAKRFHLIKPTRCEHAPLPRWLLWWIGKPRLKKRLGTLDEVLLASVKKSATKLNRDGGLFGKHWEIDLESGSQHAAEGDRRRDLYLYPGMIDTGRGALFVSLTASESRAAAAPKFPEWTLPYSNRSFVAFSEPFLGLLARNAFSRISELPRKPTGILRKLLKSDELVALVPGLRGLAGKEKLHFTIKTGSPPEVELRQSDTGDRQGARSPGDGGRAVILLHLSGMEFDIWQPAEDGDRLLGALRIESGRLGLAPYANALGGVSFDVVENDWKVSSSGIEFNEDLLAATIQEVAFGEAFETRYEPLLRDGLGLGDAHLMPETFRVVDNHLLIEFGGRPQLASFPAAR